MTPRPGTVLRPTGRGLVVLGLCLMLWVLGDLARVTPARQIAAAQNGTLTAANGRHGGAVFTMRFYRGVV